MAVKRGLGKGLDSLIPNKMEDETKSLGNRTGGPQWNHKQRRADAHIRLQQLSCFLPILPAPPELHARRIKNEAHL